MDQYHLFDELARGPFNSIVYRGRKKQTIDYVAIKSVEKSSALSKQRLVQSVSVQHGLNHPHIVAFQAWYETTNHLWVIEEYCAGLSLLQQLQQDGKMPEPIVAQIARQLLQAVHYVHSRGFLLGSSLSTASLLSNERGDIKLSNFSHASTASQYANGAWDPSENVDSRNRSYLAPELLAASPTPPSIASDLYACGCIIFEILFGEPPPAQPAHASSVSFAIPSSVLHVEIVNDRLTTSSLATSPSLQHLLCGLLHPMPHHRSDWSALRQHPWLQMSESSPLTADQFSSFAQPLF